jgi:tagaturonate epimerase
MKLSKYSWGIGDRFTHQGEALLKAIKKAEEKNILISPVWNKSNREHLTIGSMPKGTREAADAAVKTLDWPHPYFVDADHINLNTVDRFIDIADFFTIDVADYIGQKTDRIDIDAFIYKNKHLLGAMKIPGIDETFTITEGFLNQIGEKYLYAVKQAAVIYQHIRKHKSGDFITEVSMDEVDQPQTPIELYFILSILAEHKVPAQTIAPKFSGRFNKGVDYEGDMNQFAKEFEDDLMVIDYAIKQFGLPEELKLSVHSGSDKFSIYPVMGRLIKKHDKGIHVKTAGTTWLEEAIGLSLAGGQALELVKDIYKKAYTKKEELCKPYATVIDIHDERLPSPDEVGKWDSTRMAEALRHVPGNPNYNPDMRQLVHVAYKLAAEKQNVYTDLLKEHKELIGQQVTENIWDRHIKRLFEI